MVVGRRILDRSTPVTNREFGEFVADTGYVTIAEHRPRPKDMSRGPAAYVPGGFIIVRPSPGPVAVGRSNWWDSNSAPSGVTRRLRSSIAALLSSRRPRHLSRCDRLRRGPARRANRGGMGICREGRTGGTRSSPGETSSSPADGRHGQRVAGHFPWRNLAADGFERTSPVDHFRRTVRPLDMIGNVGMDEDWYPPATGGGC